MRHTLHLRRGADCVWRFDDKSRGIRDEPFVGATNRAIDWLADGAVACDVEFADEPFGDATVILDYRDGDIGGWTMWWCAAVRMECPLCPVAWAYLDHLPQRIYAARKQ